MASETKKEFSSDVVNFSSEYGINQSYTARNLAGPTRIWTKYGDFVDAFVLRTYGKWWKRCPSAVPKLSRVAPDFVSEDFVELEFKQAVVPESINIYETYHPGSVVRILACNTTSKDNAPGQVKWVTLWSGQPQCKDIPQAVRLFSPPLKKISFPTRSIRLEFNSEDCGYYTELDAVELVGKVPARSKALADRAAGFAVDITSRLLRNLTLYDRQVSSSSQDGDDEDFDKWGFWALLPDELIQAIFSYLDIISLSKVAQTCTLLLKNAYDPYLLPDLDLQSRWNTVDNVALESLVTRCSIIQRLNLSWTGGGGLLTENVLCRFLEECGSELKALYLACCLYISKKTLQTVARVCTHLEELDLQSCTKLQNDDFTSIQHMKKLKRLNLYRLQLNGNALKAIGQCEDLQHLNLGGTTIFGEVDKFFPKLKKLISLDLWRVKRVDGDLLEYIVKSCPNLEELDIGWCPAITRQHVPCEFICSRCPKLKKLFLTAGRHTNDEDMLSVAKYCKDMEQLDILGTSKVAAAAVECVAKECPKLILFDISFCGSVKDDDVKMLTSNFPHVCFKRSFQQ